MYTYDVLGRVLPVTPPKATPSFARVTTKHLYDGLNLIRETTAGTNKEYVFGPSIDEPLALYASGAVSYLNADGLGSIVATNTTAGAVGHNSVFDAWGMAKSETGARIHSFTFTGRETAEAGLHVYRARLLDPARGRFQLEDPSGRDVPTSSYSYAANGPLAFSDPLGNKPRPVSPNPPYDPGYWNDGGSIQYSNNCYSYACNRPTAHPPYPDKPQPGGASGREYAELTCKSIIAAAKSDGWIAPADKNTCCPTGQHRVYLVISPGRDYHWYREDADGGWSSKRGHTAVNRTDAGGRVIVDPDNADHGNYTVRCGFLCATNVP